MSIQVFEGNSLVQKIKKLEEPKSFYNGFSYSAEFVPNSLLIFSRQQNNFHSYPINNHRRFVLIINYQTNGQINLDGTLVNLKEGQALLIFPGQTMSYPAMPKKELIWLFATFELRNSSKICSLKNIPTSFNDDIEEDLSVLVDAYQQKAQSDCNIAYLNTLLGKILIKLAKQNEIISPKFNIAHGVETRDQMFFREIHKYIVTNIHRTIDLKELSKTMGTSTSHMRNTFKDITSFSLGKYIINQRLAYAKNLLIKTDSTVAEIAEKCGYSNAFSFSHVFKKYLNSSPTEFRKKVRA